jgi:hypothetical protein
MDAPELLGMVREATLRHAEPVREAPAISRAMVEALERLVVASPTPAFTLAAWFVLIMVYGTLRFNDVQHIRTTSIKLHDTHLSLMIGQSKNDRKRKGRLVVIPNAGIATAQWLTAGYDAFRSLLYTERDFLIPTNKVVGQTLEWTLSDPITYDGFRKLLVNLFHTVASVEQLGPEETSLAGTYTAHSMRATVPTFLAEHGASGHVIQLQGGWKSASMAAKYTRAEQALPCTSCSGLQRP